MPFNNSQRREQVWRFSRIYTSSSSCRLHWRIVLITFTLNCSSINVKYPVLFNRLSELSSTCVLTFTFVFVCVHHLLCLSWNSCFQQVSDIFCTCGRNTDMQPPAQKHGVSMQIFSHNSVFIYFSEREKARIQKHFGPDPRLNWSHLWSYLMFTFLSWLVWNKYKSGCRHQTWLKRQETESRRRREEDLLYSVLLVQNVLVSILLNLLEVCCLSLPLLLFLFYHLSTLCRLFLPVLAGLPVPVPVPVPVFDLKICIYFIRTSLPGPLVQRAVQVTHCTLFPLKQK